MGTGLKGLGEKQVNFSADFSGQGVTGAQADPAITALSNGNFVVVYESPHAGNTDLLAHFFDAGGNATNPPLPSLLNGVVAINGSANETIHPAVAATANGGFVVAYTDITQQAIIVQRYDSTTGIGAQFIVDSGTNHAPNARPLDHAAVATFADGTILVVWEYVFSATDSDLDFALLNSTASGFVKNPAPVINQNAFEGEARVATSGNVAAIVYAAGAGTINGGQDIILRPVNSSGNNQGPPATIFGTNSSDAFSHPDVSLMSDGRFVIVARDDTAGAILASAYDPVTHAVTPLFNFGGATGTATSLHVAGVPAGGFVLSFDFPTGDVFEARFGPDGSPLFPAGLANSFTSGTQAQNAIAANASGTVFFAWQDAGSGNPNSTDTDTRIEAQAFQLQLPSQSDFNRDQHSDILWRSDNGDDTIWFMNGGTIASGADLASIGAPWHIQDTGDFDGDGHADILWRSDNGDNAIWLMNGGTMVGHADLTGIPAPWIVADVADFDGGGKADILWRNPVTGQNTIWFMDGGTKVGQADLTGIPAPWVIAGAADFDGDGRADILWRDPDTGQNTIWFMNGGNKVGQADLTGIPAPWRIADTGDFNGDGKADILWRDPATGQNAIWFMNGGTKIGHADLLGVAAPWDIVETGDYNGDGNSDILWRDPATGQNAIWFMNGGTVIDHADLPGIGAPWHIVYDGVLV